MQVMGAFSFVTDIGDAKGVGVSCDCTTTGVVTATFNYARTSYTFRVTKWSGSGLRQFFDRFYTVYRDAAAYGVPPADGADGLHADKQ